MKPLSRSIMALLLAAVQAPSCNGDTDNGDGDSGDADTDVASDVDGESADVPDGDGSELESYPPLPYGTGVGETIGNLEFQSAGGGVIDMQDLHADPSTQLLLVYATAGWCTICTYESGDLPEIYTDYHSQGLEILAAVFEDDTSSPATVDYAIGYRDYYGFMFPIVAVDPDVIDDYFDKSLAPMNMFIDLDTMEILDIQTGYTVGGSVLRADIETYLAQVD